MAAPGRIETSAICAVNAISTSGLNALLGAWLRLRLAVDAKPEMEVASVPNAAYCKNRRRLKSIFVTAVGCLF